MAAKCAQSTSSSHPATASMAFSIHRESQPLPSTKLHNENSLGFSTWTFLCLYSLFILIAPVCEWQKNSLSYIFLLTFRPSAAINSREEQKNSFPFRIPQVTRARNTSEMNVMGAKRDFFKNIKVFQSLREKSFTHAHEQTSRFIRPWWWCTMWECFAFEFSNEFSLMLCSYDVLWPIDAVRDVWHHHKHFKCVLAIVRLGSQLMLVRVFKHIPHISMIA